MARLLRIQALRVLLCTLVLAVGLVMGCDSGGDVEDTDPREDPASLVSGRWRLQYTAPTLEGEFPMTRYNGEARSLVFHANHTFEFSGPRMGAVLSESGGEWAYIGSNKYILTASSNGVSSELIVFGDILSTASFWFDGTDNTSEGLYYRFDRGFI